MKSLSAKTFQCGVTVQGLTTLSGTVYLTALTNTATWDYVIVGTSAQGQLYTRTYAQLMSDVSSGITLSLDGLSDVVAPTPSTGQLLRYNGIQWANWTPNFLSAEADTLDSVTTRGNTTTNAITVGGLTVATNLIYTDTVNGRVGIGTTGLVPGILLTINGGVSITAGQSLSLDPSAGIYMVASSSQFRLYNNSIAALSVASTGNVLINTTTDSGYKLDVNGTARIKGNVDITTSGGTNVLLAYSSYVQAWQSFYVSQGGGAHNFAVSNASSGGNAYFNNVNVGIGTTSPSSLLNVVATGSAPAALTVQDGARKVKIGRDQIEVTDLSDAVSTMYLQPNANLVINANSGNVGIGTQPSQKLDVNGYAKFTSGIILDGGATSHYREFIWNTSGFNRWDLYVHGAEPGSNVGGDLFLARYADNGAYLANAVTFQRSTGNVGIGTTSPSQLLHVAGNIRVTGAFYDSNNQAGSAGQILKSTGTGTDWVSLSEITGVDGTGTANYLAKWSDADTITNSLIYDNGTSVTINATSGGIYLNSNIGFGWPVNINDQFKFYYGQLQGNGNAYFTTYLNVGTSSNLGATLNVRGAGATSVTKSLYIPNSDDSRTLSYTDDGKLTLSNGTYTTKWYIGSGYNPTLEFSARGEITWGNGAIFRFYSTGDTTDYRLENGTFYTNNSQARFYAGGSGYLGFQTIGATSPYDAIGAVFTDNNTVSLRFFYKNTGSDIEGMRLTSSGNFLVGTTTDSGYKLDVNGIFGLGVAGGRLFSTAGNMLQANFGNAQFFVGSSGGESIDLSANSTGEIRFGTASAQRVVIKNGGNVGIGTTNPGFKLDVNGTARVNQGGVNGSGQALIVAGSGDVQLTDGGSLFFGSYDYGGSTYIRAYDDSNIMYFYLNGTNMAYFRSDRAYFNANVGIGTSNPTHKLTVTGDGSGTMKVGSPGASGNYTGISLNGSLDISNYNILSSPTDNHLYINRPTGNNIYFRVNNNDQVIINSSGNVGIGTSSPATKLDVSGVITATGGNSTNWNTAYGWGNHSSAGYVPQTRTLTINGTSYDLSANRSWTIATTTPGGSDTQFQYNSSGSLAGASALTYNSANNRIGVNQASPGYDFDVNGQVRVQDKLRVGTVNSGNGVVHMSSSATINPNTTTIVWAQNVSVGMCAFIEYYILNNNSLTDQRAGTIMVTWNQSGTPTIAHTETTTPDIGSTTSINFTSSLVGADARINAVNSSANPYTIVMSYKYF